jgi:hypothetical protein
LRSIVFTWIDDKSTRPIAATQTGSTLRVAVMSFLVFPRPPVPPRPTQLFSHLDPYLLIWDSLFGITGSHNEQFPFSKKGKGVNSLKNKRVLGRITWIGHLMCFKLSGLLYILLEFRTLRQCERWRPFIIMSNMIVKDECDDSLSPRVGLLGRVDWTWGWTGNTSRVPPCVSWNPWLGNSCLKQFRWAHMDSRFLQFIYLCEKLLLW